MPVNFPNSPTVGELFVTNGKTYQWDGEKWTTDTTVTKTDIGLSNVQNYSVANQAEAEAGVLDNLYMTPLKTSQAIAALAEHETVTAASSVDNSGNTVIQDVTLDGNGHVTGLTSATIDSVTNANTATNQNGSSAITNLKFWQGSQAEYDTQTNNGTTADNDTLYFITEV